MTNINDLNRSGGQMVAGPAQGMGQTNGSINAGASDSAEIDLSVLFAQLRRNRYLLGTCLLLGLLLGAFFHFTSNKTYTASTILMINVEGEEASQQLSNIVGALAQNKRDAIAPAYAVARSTKLFEQVVDEEKLLRSPEFNSDLREETLKQKLIGYARFAVKTVSGLMPGESSQEAAAPAWMDPEVLRQRRAVSILQNRVVVTDMQDNLRLKIAVTLEDRAKSADIANTMAEKLGQKLSATKATALDNAKEWIEREAGRVEGTLREIEGQINSEISAGSVLPSTESLGQNAERLVEGELILDANRRRGAALTRLGEVVARIEGGETAQGAFSTLPDELRTELLADYVEIFRWERRDEPPSQAELLSARRLIERDLDTQSAATTRREQEILPVRAYTRKLSTAQNRYLQLETSYAASTELLKTLRVRLAELQIERAGEVEKMTVLDPALPPLRNDSPPFLYTLALYSILGLMLGLGIMLLRFFKRDAFLSIEDVEKTFDAPAITMVPNIQKKYSEEFAWQHLDGEIQEAYRRAYAAVFVMPDERGVSRSVMVTSSMPSEGKTTASLYIAAAAVEDGKKTLVIDLDYRKRSVSRYLRLTREYKREREFGVYSVFRGDATLQEAAQPDPDNGVYFDVLTTSGRVNTKDSSFRESMSARSVRELIEKAEEEYDVVVVDVPPILAVQDAIMIGRMVDSILSVVSTQHLGTKKDKSIWNRQRDSAKFLTKKAAKRAAQEWKRANLQLTGLIVRGEQTELYEYYGYNHYHYDYAAAGDDRSRRASQRRRKPRKKPREDVGRHQASGNAAE